MLDMLGLEEVSTKEFGDADRGGRAKDGTGRMDDEKNITVGSTRSTRRGLAWAVH